MVTIVLFSKKIPLLVAPGHSYSLTKAVILLLLFCDHLFTWFHPHLLIWDRYIYFLICLDHWKRKRKRLTSKSLGHGLWHGYASKWLNLTFVRWADWRLFLRFQLQYWIAYDNIITLERIHASFSRVRRMVHTVCLCACMLDIYKPYVLRLEAISEEHSVLVRVSVPATKHHGQKSKLWGKGFI